MTPPPIRDALTHLFDRLHHVRPVARVGRVTRVLGTTLQAQIPQVALGDFCRIARSRGDRLVAQVVGLDEQHGVTLMPLGDLNGAALDDPVEPFDEAQWLPDPDACCGRVLDALGRAIDAGTPLAPVDAATSPIPSPMQRKRITAPLCTGVRAIDGLLSIGGGQRVGIYAPAGVGKSTLLASLARNVEADIVIIALIGERGREVAPFIDDNLGPAALAKSTIVVSTSDDPAILRLRAAHTASALAEAHRARGRRVVLFMDSVTRYARALREVGLAAGELPVRRGFPPSVFAALPQLFERAGADARGDITAFYTVLVEGELADDPIAEETKSLLDGHIILCPDLARRRHFPAIDVLASVSRLMTEIVPEEHRAAASELLRVFDAYERNRAKIELGLYEAGSNADLDDAIASREKILQFLQQGGERSSWSETIHCLRACLAERDLLSVTER